MTPEQFTYWLQGFIELTDSDDVAVLDAPQWKMIKDHLKEVFDKRTPDRQLIKDNLGVFRIHEPRKFDNPQLTDEPYPRFIC